MKATILLEEHFPERQQSAIRLLLDNLKDVTIEKEQTSEGNTFIEIDIPDKLQFLFNELDEHYFLTFIT